VTGLLWVLLAGAVVGGGVVLWFAEALYVLEGVDTRRTDRTTCACCRHDEVAHQHVEQGRSCSQCPCIAYRPSG